MAAKKSAKKLVSAVSDATDVPVLRPSLPEFSNFLGFVNSIDKAGGNQATVKVIPPDGWKARENYSGADPLLRCCGTQNVDGDGDGVYDLSVEETGRSVFLSDLKKIMFEAGDEPLSDDHKTAETEFWRDLGFGVHTVYTGHSLNATLFDSKTTTWNLARMEGIVKDKDLKSWTGGAQGINGVSVSMARAARGWKCTDQSCIWASYLHLGDPRTVYTVPASHRKEVIALIQRLKGDESSEDTFINQNCLIMDPVVLTKHGIPFTQVIHEPGEFLLHFPETCVMSFAHGFCIVENKQISLQGGTQPAPAQKAAQDSPKMEKKPAIPASTSQSFPVGGPQMAGRMPVPMDPSQMFMSMLPSHHPEFHAHFQQHLPPSGNPAHLNMHPMHPFAPHHPMNGNGASHPAELQKPGKGSGGKKGGKASKGPSPGPEQTMAMIPPGMPIGGRGAMGMGGAGGMGVPPPMPMPGHGVGSENAFSIMQAYAVHHHQQAQGMTPQPSPGPVGAKKKNAKSAKVEVQKTDPIRVPSASEEPPMESAARSTTTKEEDDDDSMSAEGLAGLASMNDSKAIRRRKKRRMEDTGEMEMEGVAAAESLQKETLDKNKNCHFCEHAPKRCSIFACLDPVCDQMFCENCCKRHLANPTGFKGQPDANCADWRCPICTRKCCCTKVECTLNHLHCKRYRRRMKHTIRKGVSFSSAEAEDGSPPVEKENGVDEAEQAIKTQVNGVVKKEPETSTSVPARLEPGPRTQHKKHQQGTKAASAAAKNPEKRKAAGDGASKSVLAGAPALLPGVKGIMNSSMNASAPSSSAAGRPWAENAPLTPSFTHQGAWTPNSNMPEALGLAGTPLAVGTPLTPLDNYLQAGTPFGGQLDDSALQEANSASSGPANCSWFDHLFGGGDGGNVSQMALVQQQLAAGQIQLPGLSQHAQAAMKQMAAQQSSSSTSAPR